MCINYDGDASSMLKALVEVGFMDFDMTLHNWDTRNEYHKVFSERAKKAASVRWKDKKRNEKKGKERIRKERSKHSSSIASSISQKGKLLLELWNNTCVSLPHALKLTTTRFSHIKTRLSEIPEMEKWKEIFQRLENSRFCKGFGNQDWIATFDWIIKNPDNPVKVLEGKYDDRKRDILKGTSFEGGINEES